MTLIYSLIVLDASLWNAVSVMTLLWTAVSLFKSNYFILLYIDLASLNPQQENQFKGQRND